MLVYEIVDASGTCIYVGSTNSPLSSRRAVHRCLCERHPERPLYKYMAENGGWGAFTFNTISQHLDITRQELYDHEATAIAARKPICNKNRPVTGMSHAEYNSAWGGSRVECECGSEVRRDSLARHFRSNKHLMATLS